MIASVEVVNCTAVYLHVADSVQQYVVDKTAECQVELNEKALASHPIITTANVSAMNVTVPNEKPDEDPVSLTVSAHLCLCFVS